MKEKAQQLVNDVWKYLELQVVSIYTCLYIYSGNIKMTLALGTGN